MVLRWVVFYGITVGGVLWYYGGWCFMVLRWMVFYGIMVDGVLKVFIFSCLAASVERE
jgi:hypothetical protein